MQIIIISSKNTRHKHFNINGLQLFIIILVSFIGLSFFINTLLSKKSFEELLYVSNNELSPVENFKSVSAITDEYNSEINAYYAQQLGQLQAESIRLKAISAKIAQVAGMDLSSFNLEEKPGQGGVDQDGHVLSGASLQIALSQLEKSFELQDAQLAFLDSYYLTADSIQSAIPQGSPIKKGWISSYYGNRLDPFNGKKTFHYGLDFAGKKDSEIFAVAEGIVVWTGTRSGYGKMIDIDHGNGYTTRYAHAKELIVKVGERVQKGTAIAIMGSTGRSTGPHVHFEILQDGKTLNPYNFVKG